MNTLVYEGTTTRVNNIPVFLSNCIFTATTADIDREYFGSASTSHIVMVTIQNQIRVTKVL